MQGLIDCIADLKKSKIDQLIKNKVKEFNEFRKKSIDSIFEELCFCIMTANCSAEKCIEVQKKVRDGFQNLDQFELSKKLKLVWIHNNNLKI